MTQPRRLLTNLQAATLFWPQAFRKNATLLLAVMALLGLPSCKPNLRPNDRPNDLPNVVFIMADDMGWGDVQAYNPESLIATPNIDRLSQEGLMFMDAHSGAAVCSPTRYGVMTGRFFWGT